MARLIYVDNTMTADDLATQGARALAANVLIYCRVPLEYPPQHQMGQISICDVPAIISIEE